MPLVYFIAGIIFTEIILPLLKKLGELIMTRLELSEASMGEVINASNIRMKQAAIAAENEQEVKYQIGFAVPACDDEEEEGTE